ncbi:MAG: hypothetical protein ACE5KF_05055 [Kiloniellaceae bacterium]
MRIPIIGTVMFAAALILVPTGAMAQVQQCDQRENVIGHLAKKYHEAPVAIGVTSTGGLVEVLSTGNGDTWTIIVSKPDGLSCLVAAGEGWRTIKSNKLLGDPNA